MATTEEKLEEMGRDLHDFNNALDDIEDLYVKYGMNVDKAGGACLVLFEEFIPLIIAAGLAVKNESKEQQ